MIIRQFLAKQLGHPSGIFGRLLMKLLNKGNADMNDFTFQQLDLLSGDAVLEIGFGGGYLLEKIIQSQLPSRVVGIDPQVDVINMGYQKFSRAIARDLELQQATGENLPYEDNSFTKICTVNTVYFWSDPQMVLKECKRVLQPQGKLIICYNSAEFLEQAKLTQHGFTAYQPEELKFLMASADFVDMFTVTADGGTGNGIFYCTSGLVKG
ncbi:MAG: methyltransferase domain-containing protein [Cyanobacteria bacterium J06631_2]